MNNPPKIDHREIVSYLRGVSNRKELTQIQKIRQEDPVYELFFDLIDKLKEQVNISEYTRTDKVTPISFSLLEDILMRIMAGDILSTDAQQLIKGLISSPIFYQRLLSKLSPAALDVSIEEFPEVSQIQIKSDDELLKQILFEAKSQKVKTSKAGMPIKNVLHSLIDIWDRLKQLFESPKRFPRYAFAISIAILVFLISLSVYENISKKESFHYYVYDHKVPYEYDMSSLRGTPVNFEDDPDISLFINQFKLGISDYMVRDYKNAINTFEDVMPLAGRINTRLKSKEFLPWMRDFYFYLGLSHLAYSNDKELNKESSAYHIHESIQFLLQADSLVTEFDLPKNDREIYFVGLAFSLGGIIDSAKVYLNRIESKSIFYKDSQKLIRKSSKD